MEKQRSEVMILGPTASGKTSFAVKLARRLNAEIVSADSRQVYRGLDIGSGKDIGEYTFPDGYTVPSHLLDIADPAKADFSLADYLLQAKNIIGEIHSRGALPLICGGTALYLHGLLCGYHLHGGGANEEQRVKLRAMETAGIREVLRQLDPEDEILRKEPANRSRLIRRIEMLQSTAETEKEKAALPDRKRNILILGVLRSRTQVRDNIEKRLDERLNAGMLEEAVRLHDEQGVSWHTMEIYGLEYRYMALHLQGKLTFEQMREELLCKIRQFAKRQDSWYRKIEKDGFPIYWLSPEKLDEAESLVRDFLAGKELPPPEIRLSEIHYGKA